MADIELVIKLDEELYNYMQKGEYDKHLEKRFDYQIRFAVKDGTPLPKGHGRIDDVDKILDEMRATKTYDIPFVLERIKPIIEADKEQIDEVE